MRGVQFDNITTNLKIHSWFLKIIHSLSILVHILYINYKCIGIWFGIPKITYSNNVTVDHSLHINLSTFVYAHRLVRVIYSLYLYACHSVEFNVFNRQKLKNPYTAFTWAYTIPMVSYVQFLIDYVCRRGGLCPMKNPNHNKKYLGDAALFTDLVLLTKYGIFLIVQNDKGMRWNRKLVHGSEMWTMVTKKSTVEHLDIDRTEYADLKHFAGNNYCHFCRTQNTKLVKIIDFDAERTSELYLDTKCDSCYVEIYHKYYNKVDFTPTEDECAVCSWSFCNMSSFFSYFKECHLCEKTKSRICRHRRFPEEFIQRARPYSLKSKSILEVRKRYSKECAQLPKTLAVEAFAESNLFEQAKMEWSKQWPELILPVTLPNSPIN